MRAEGLGSEGRRGATKRSSPDDRLSSPRKEGTPTNWKNDQMRAFQRDGPPVRGRGNVVPNFGLFVAVRLPVVEKKLLLLVLLQEEEVCRYNFAAHLVHDDVLSLLESQRERKLWSGSRRNLGGQPRGEAHDDSLLRMASVRRLKGLKNFGESTDELSQQVDLTHCQARMLFGR